jgi:CheY-like chemotaxis protein
MTPIAELAGLAVLVVEDDYYLADDTQKALESAGARVAGPYARAAESLSRLAENGIDCGVLDLNLGEGPSFVAARALKQRGVPFIFLTGYDRDVLPDDFGGIELLEKPVEPQTLIRAIARACGRADPSKV